MLMPQIGKCKMWIVNVYNTQPRIALTREKEIAGDSDARKWICYLAAAMAYKKKKKIGKINWCIRSLYTR